MTDWTEHEFDSVVDKAQALKSMVNIVEVAELLGLEPDHHGKVHSPYNDADDTPSCQLYEPDHFFDFSTGQGGDAIDLVMAVTGKTWGQAVAVLWNRGLRVGYEPGRHEATRKPEPIDLTDTFFRSHGGDLLYFSGQGHVSWAQRLSLASWAQRLGLPGEALAALYEAKAIGYLDGETMWIPHWHDGIVRGIKTRGINGGKGSITGSQYSHGLYSIALAPKDCRVAVITEGESDCWALSWHWRDQPVDVLALPCGAGVWRDEWNESLARYDRVYLAFDNDQAGEKAAEKVTRSIGWAKAERLRVPDLFNDVRAAYIGGWRPNPPVS